MIEPILVSIPIREYAELIEDRTKLKVLCTLLHMDEPYYYKKYQQIVGEDLLPDLPKKEVTTSSLVIDEIKGE